MKKYTYCCFLLLLSLSSAFAQINRPRTTPGATPSQPSAPSQTRSSEPTPKNNDGAVATASASGIEIKLTQVEGNATSQQVTFTVVFTNPKGNADVQLRGAYAIDPAGDAYTDANPRVQRFTLYTDVPKKETRMVQGVLIKIKTLQFAKLDFYHPATRKWEAVEFRNLTIDWK